MVWCRSRNQQSLITALMAENDKLANLPHWHNIAEVVLYRPSPFPIASRPTGLASDTRAHRYRTLTSR